MVSMFHVILVIGVYGALRRDELLKITIDDIEDNDSIIIIRIPDSKIHTTRGFGISSPDQMKIYLKYRALRPAVYYESKFFVNNYLNLARPKTYTGHCFKRSSATVLADAEADITTVKRHGGGVLVR
ncbi:hypothetical protein NQ317_013150 [Molorchus minor]|uniref:Tyr recombinase domain-containing protein n=1 Tax=Molorchus minor TaxID=1323400 RepID=A0ABQ9IZT8_9CUCU|nr:hypothetical protein NQ317_013150 [Molorchus minor]